MLMEDAVLSRNSVTKIEVFLRAIGRDVLRIYLLLLGWLAIIYFKAFTAKSLPGFVRNEAFMKKNNKIQEAYGRFFASYYHFCPDCEGCCHAMQIPYWHLDLILYQVPPNPDYFTINATLRNFLWEIGYIFHHYLTTPLRLFQSSNAKDCKAQISKEAPKAVCLGAEGCVLPWGRRPAHCIFFACDLFLKNMNWTEYWRYMSLSMQYLVHLTVSLMAAVGERRQQVRVPSA